ncbi:MAG: cytochrome c [Planctomycetota bacterium]|nr:cytochrome c [Planctomycetota bacterium]
MRQLSLIIVILVTSGIGCDVVVDQFPANDVFSLTLARNRGVPTETAKNDANAIVTSLFGTPDKPQWPSSLFDDEASVGLVGTENLVRAAGPVSSEEDGTHLGLFREHCVTCHGIAGDGAGPASATQNPYPRDFRHGVFKWKSSERGDKPTRDDLLSLLKHGVPGTGMPAFTLLADEDVEALVDYVIYLSVRGEFERRLMAAAIDQLDYEETAPSDEAKLTLSSGTEGQEVIHDILNRVARDWGQAQPVNVPKTYRDLQGESLRESIARGDKIFHGPIANCVGCHGSDGNGQAVTLDYDDWAKEYSTRLGLDPKDRDAMRPYRNAGALRPRPVQPRNLQQGVFRGGSEPETLYRRITQGIAGTPMPAVAVVEEPNGVGLTDNQIWDLVRYLRAAAMPEPRSADGGDESGEGKER